MLCKWNISFKLWWIIVASSALWTCSFLVVFATAAPSSVTVCVLSLCFKVCGQTIWAGQCAFKGRCTALMYRIIYFSYNTFKLFCKNTMCRNVFLGWHDEELLKPTIKVFNSCYFVNFLNSNILMWLWRPPRPQEGDHGSLLLLLFSGMCSSLMMTPPPHPTPPPVSGPTLSGHGETSIFCTLLRRAIRRVSDRCFPSLTLQLLTVWVEWNSYWMFTQNYETCLVCIHVCRVKKKKKSTKKENDKWMLMELSRLPLHIQSVTHSSVVVSSCSASTHEEAGLKNHSVFYHCAFIPAYWILQDSSSASSSSSSSSTLIFRRLSQWGGTGSVFGFSLLHLVFSFGEYFEWSQNIDSEPLHTLYKVWV